MAIISANIGSYLVSQFIQNLYGQSFSAQNSSLTINTISCHLYRTVSALQSSLQLIQSATISLAIIFSLFFFSPEATFLLLFIFSIIYLGMAFLSRKLLHQSSISVKSNSKSHLKTMQETFSAYKELVIFQKREFYLERYLNYDLNLRKSEAFARSIALFPRYVIEAALFLSVIFIASYSLVNGDLSSANNLFTILGLLCVASLKIVPAMQQIYTGWASVSSTKESIIDVYNALPSYDHSSTRKYLGHKYQPLSFQRQIALHNVSYTYPGSSNFALKGNLRIVKGQKVGLVGKSGSGKSTLCYHGNTFSFLWITVYR